MVRRFVLSLALVFGTACLVAPQGRPVAAIDERPIVVDSGAVEYVGAFVVVDVFGRFAGERVHEALAFASHDVVAGAVFDAQRIDSHYVAFSYCPQRSDEDGVACAVDRAAADDVMLRVAAESDAGQPLVTAVATLGDGRVADLSFLLPSSVR